MPHVIGIAMNSRSEITDPIRVPSRPRDPETPSARRIECTRLRRVGYATSWSTISDGSGATGTPASPKSLLNASPCQYSS